MAHRGKPPEQGVRVGAWRFDTVPKGQIRTGWLAGPTHGLVVHPGRATKPCLRIYLGQDATCEGCALQRRAEWFGYVPVKRDDGRPLVIGIHESQFWIVDAIVPGSRILWGRKEAENEGVYVQRGPDRPTWRSFWPDERPNHSLLDYLVLKLWKMPDLMPVLREEWGEVCQRVVTEEMPFAVGFEEPSPAAARDDRPVKGASKVQEAIADVNERFRQQYANAGASKNGKGG